MRYQGKITTWNDSKGFGFIAPNGGGAEIFLHISGFSQRMKRPSVGDLVTYETEAGGDQRAAAIKVLFVEVGTPRSRTPSRSWLPIAAALVAMTAIGFFGYTELRRSYGASNSSTISDSRDGGEREASTGTRATNPHRLAESSGESFRCEGKTRCSQMASCAEAEFYLQNCTGTAIDGDRDGIPCEDQLCGH